MENGKLLYYLYNSLAPQTGAVELEAKFQASDFVSTSTSSGVGGEGAGGARAPPKVLICQNLCKIPGNLGKNYAQRCLASKNGAQRLQKNTWRRFLEVTPKKRFSRSLWERSCRQSRTKNFSGKFGAIWAKILRTTKNWPAPTPVPPSKSIWLRLWLQPSSIAWTPATQPWPVV